jgi:hypothetical protein
MASPRQPLKPRQLLLKQYISNYPSSGLADSTMPEAKVPFPGELATPLQIFELAETYRSATLLLGAQGRAGNPLSRAPYRLAAMQAIELYLNALLLHQGHDARQIRGMQHDFAARTKTALDHGLKLRERTCRHLASMAGNREYLITRYGPEMTSTVSQINRLTATLDEVAKKVSVILKAPTASQRPAPLALPRGIEPRFQP